ncbi:MAG: zinc-ribbon domain-containing protein, partial [Actinobacteria bacterium]|nr:zinc-ribbon domain-containing protein [Actinomycetota bacterium]
MVICPSCGNEVPEGSRFCNSCGAALDEAPPARSLEERKIVSVLFCDLVGFTAASNAADPEDVRARIRPYHQRLRQEIERYGGTVEKFVGDAVMAVFGAPVAHEDDPERAVRAGLRILEAIAELNEAEPILALQVRIGINTGEAVVALGARPEQGEGIVTGDVVNTASRLQAAAPVDGIACSEQTYLATERVFTYDELEPRAGEGQGGAACGLAAARARAPPPAKLDQVLPADDPDRAWLEARLLPLVGAGGEPAAQEESFTAWRRFCESLASERPAVLVFEDLHWADAALLSFLEHLADWSEGVPMLLLCTARPELYERHPHFGAEARNAQRINLAPLSDEETARLIGSLLERAVLPAETQQALLERAGGNPLYAEEFVRLLADRHLLTGSLEDLPFPDSVQALIAARLDTLSPERKSLLQDAAVVGKLFWSGALVEMGGREAREVEVALHELARKELVRPARTSSMQGEAEYGFWHVLVRDVCYGQIPRAARAARHRAAAAWLERKAGERAEDLADVLAHHYLTALELGRATGQTGKTDELEAAAIRYLALAGERALALDVESAEASLARALELAPVGHPERARLLEHWAKAAHQQGRLKEAKGAFEEAAALYREQDELLAAGRALSVLVTTLWALGHPRRKQTMAEALALLEAQPAGPELAVAYGELAGVHLVDGAMREAIAVANRALQLAAALGLAEPGRALGFRGTARGSLGEREGLDDLRRALARSLEQGRSRDAAVHHRNLAALLEHYEGPEAAWNASREGVEFCERRGIREFALTIRAMSLRFLVERGMSEQARREAEALARQAEANGHFPTLNAARSVQLRLLAQRGEGAQAIATAEELATRAKDAGIAGEVATAYPAAAQLLLAAGRSEQARSLLHELERLAATDDLAYAGFLPELVRGALA